MPKGVYNRKLAKKRGFGKVAAIPVQSVAQSNHEKCLSASFAMQIPPEGIVIKLTNGVNVEGTIKLTCRGLVLARPHTKNLPKEISFATLMKLCEAGLT